MYDLLAFRYSNVGYMLLREVVEAVAETTFEALLAQYIAVPLGLEHTTALVAPNDLRALAPTKSRTITRGQTPVYTRYLHPARKRRSGLTTRPRAR
jgi:CubicO group peptidase (beta-lactamase class C family)